MTLGGNSFGTFGMLTHKEVCHGLDIAFTLMNGWVI